MTSQDKWIKSGWHWSFGWLRRQELDDENGYCFEDGDGDLIFTQRKDHHLVCYLDCWEDSVSHERYLTMNPEPVADILIKVKNLPDKAK
jgi:hypothetical protein